MPTQTPMNERQIRKLEEILMAQNLMIPEKQTNQLRETRQKIRNLPDEIEYFQISRQPGPTFESEWNLHKQASKVPSYYLPPRYAPQLLEERKRVKRVIRELNIPEDPVTREDCQIIENIIREHRLDIPFKDPMTGQTLQYRFIDEEETINKAMTIRPNTPLKAVIFKPYTSPTNPNSSTDQRKTALKSASFHPNTTSRLNDIIAEMELQSQIPPYRFSEVIDAFLTDSLIGGSIIATIEKAEEPETQKYQNPRRIEALCIYFVGLDKYDAPKLTVDLFTSRDHNSKKIKQWTDQCKGELIAFGAGLHTYLAKELDINSLVLADPLMAELSRKTNFGKWQPVLDYNYLFGWPPKLGKPGERTVIDYNDTETNLDNRKLGVIASPDNSKGVWQSSIYNPTYRHGYNYFQQSTLDLLNLTSKHRDWDP